MADQPPPAGPAQPARVAAPVPPPDLTEFAGATATWVTEFVDGADLQTYLDWAHHVAELLGWFGGDLGAHTAQLAALADGLAAWQRVASEGIQGLQDRDTGELPDALRSVRGAAHAVVAYVELGSYPDNAERPHRTLARIVEEMAQRQGLYLGKLIGARLEDLLNGLDNLYYYGERALAAGVNVFRVRHPTYRVDELTAWEMPALTAFRDELADTRNLLTELRAQPADTPGGWDETMSLTYFGRSLDDLA